MSRACYLRFPSGSELDRTLALRPSSFDARARSAHVSRMVTLRPATRADVPVILALIRELATYEREPDAVVATEADLLRDGFGASPLFHVLLAESSDDDSPAAPTPETSRVVGFAFYLFTYSTWKGRPILYLEDLFVRPSHRKRGIGIALMRRLARIAVEKHCARFVWEVLDWNEPAIVFYESIGADMAREWLNVRLEGSALERLSEAGVSEP